MAAQRRRSDRAAGLPGKRPQLPELSSVGDMSSKQRSNKAPTRRDRYLACRTALQLGAHQSTPATVPTASHEDEPTSSCVAYLRPGFRDRTLPDPNDEADGRGTVVHPRVVRVTADSPRWMRWPGRCGAVRARWWIGASRTPRSGLRISGRGGGPSPTPGPHRRRLRAPHRCRCLLHRFADAEEGGKGAVANAARAASAVPRFLVASTRSKAEDRRPLTAGRMKPVRKRRLPGPTRAALDSTSTASRLFVRRVGRLRVAVRSCGVSPRAAMLGSGATGARWSAAEDRAQP